MAMDNAVIHLVRVRRVAICVHAPERLGCCPRKRVWSTTLFAVELVQHRGWFTETSAIPGSGNVAVLGRLPPGDGP